VTEYCAVIGTHSTVRGDMLLYGLIPDPFPRCGIGSGHARLLCALGQTKHRAMGHPWLNSVHLFAVGQAWSSSVHLCAVGQAWLSSVHLGPWGSQCAPVCHGSSQASCYGATLTKQCPPVCNGTSLVKQRAPAFVGQLVGTCVPWGKPSILHGTSLIE